MGGGGVRIVSNAARQRIYSIRFVLSIKLIMGWTIAAVCIDTIFVGG